MHAPSSNSHSSALPLSLAEIARREESRVAVGVREIANECVPFAGGTASRDEPGAWSNAVLGAGFAGAVAADEIARMIEWYESAGIEPRVELAPYVDRTLIDGLAAAGFVVRHFENVFVRPLRPDERIEPPHRVPDDVTLEVVRPDDPETIDAFARAVVAGFLEGATELPASHLESNRRVARHPRTVTIVARRAGEIVAGGSLELCGDSGALFGLSVLPGHRRLGIQQAMLAWRLQHAARRGAAFVTISARPSVSTESNARRMGFQVAYTKVVLVRPRPGLVAVIE